MAPELMEEVVEEILVRFPADDPASLVRAALVCKAWCRLVSGTAFRRRFREFHAHHRPLLGVLYTSTTGAGGGALPAAAPSARRRRTNKRARMAMDDDVAAVRDPMTTAAASACCFVPTTTTSSFRRGPRYGWRAIDARHGRVLLRRCGRPLTYGKGLSVWDPVTDDQRDLPNPSSSFSKAMLGYSWTAAVGNSSCECDHLHCHGGPFLVVVMDVQPHVIYRAVYSSEPDAWTRLVEALRRPEPTRCLGVFQPQTTPAAVLVGTALYFLVHFNDEIVQYDLATQEVSAISVPSEFCGRLRQRSVVLVTDDDGDLGFVAANNDTQTQQLELWSMLNMNNGGEGGHFLPRRRRLIHLQSLLPPVALLAAAPRPNGFGCTDGGSRFLFIKTSHGLYSIDMNSSTSRRVSKVANDCCGDDDDTIIVPYMSFCTPNSFQGDAS